MVEEYLSTRQAAYLLKVSVPNIQTHCKKGKIKAFNKGGCSLILTSELVRCVTVELAELQRAIEYLETEDKQAFWKEQNYSKLSDSTVDFNDPDILLSHQQIGFLLKRSDTTVFQMTKMGVLTPKIKIDINYHRAFFYTTAELERYVNNKISMYDRALEFFSLQSGYETMKFWDDHAEEVLKLKRVDKKVKKTNDVPQKEEAKQVQNKDRRSDQGRNSGTASSARA